MGAQEKVDCRAVRGSDAQGLRGAVNLGAEHPDAHDPTVLAPQPATHVRVRRGRRGAVNDPKRPAHAHSGAVDDRHALTALVDGADVNSGGHLLTSCLSVVDVWCCQPAAFCGQPLSRPTRPAGDEKIECRRGTTGPALCHGTSALSAGITCRQR
jgi:hypothetical protein